MTAVVGTRAVVRPARLVGADFEVDGGDVPVAGIGTITFLAASVGVLLAVAVRRWSPRPAELFVRVAVVLTAVSQVPPLLWGHGAGTVVALVALHLLAATVMITATARRLRP